MSLGEVTLRGMLLSLSSFRGFHGTSDHVLSGFRAGLESSPWGIEFRSLYVSFCDLPIVNILSPSFFTLSSSQFMDMSTSVSLL